MIYVVNKRTKEHRRFYGSAVMAMDTYADTEFEVLLADDDGWIPWEGGECPLPDNHPCEIEFRSSIPAKPSTIPQMLMWQHTTGKEICPGDITAYRPILDTKPAHGRSDAMARCRWHYPVTRDGEPVGRVDCDPDGGAWTSAGDNRPIYREHSEPHAWGGVETEDDLIDLMNRIYPRWRDLDGYKALFEQITGRPIRSAEDKAVEEMHRAVQMADCVNFTEGMARALYRAGYRKTGGE